MSAGHEQRHGSLHHYRHHHHHHHHSLWTLGSGETATWRGPLAVRPRRRGLCIVWSDRRDNGCPPRTEERLLLQRSRRVRPGGENKNGVVSARGRAQKPEQEEPDSTSVQNRCTIVSWPCEYKCLCVYVCHTALKLSITNHSTTQQHCQVGTVPCYIKKKNKKKKKKNKRR